MHFVSFFNIFLSFIIVILYLCYNDGLVLHNLILAIILMLYIVFYPTRTCGRTMSVNIENVLPCINKVIIIIIIIPNYQRLGQLRNQKVTKWKGRWC